MKKSAIFALLGLLVLVMPAWAEAPNLLNYQGVLKDSAGNPITGTRAMTFRLYSVATGGAALWTETQSSVSVNNGLFSVLLGSVTALSPSLFSGPDRWLGVAAGSDPEMTPRQRIASVAYSLQSKGLHTDNSGNVGIGTTTPEVKLHIKQNVVGTNAYNRPQSLYFGSNDNVNLRGMLGWSAYNAPNYFLIQAVEEAVAWRNIVLAREGGNVGIGTTSPGYKLTTSASGSHLQLRRESSETTGGKIVFLELFQNDPSNVIPEVYPNIRFHHNNKYWTRIEERGGSFHFKNGDTSVDVYVPLNASAFTVASSSRFKKDITDNHYGLAEILKLQAHKFKYIEDPTNNTQIGFIAEDVVKVIPEVVSYDSEDKPTGIDYGKLSVVLVEAIKELKAENEALKHRIEVFEVIGKK